MKIKMLRGWRWIFAASTTVTLMGCLEKTNETNAQAIAEPSAAETVATPVSNSIVEVPPVRVAIPPANLSSGIAEVVKLAQSGVDEQVLLAYVEKSNHVFNPSVDEIVYLKDIGVSDSVVAKMVRRQNPTSEVAQTPSVPETTENKTAPEPAPTVSPSPSLSESPAPSYSVSAEPSSGEPTAVAPPAQEVNINYFESTLSPYGNWVEVADYGRCWQPTVVVLNRSWRPYADRGRWLYTSSGWYWQSDYSWGWAPFHYGRWHCDNRIGWVWVPGSTWGPAWVSWRYTDSHCGWAPLPPAARYYSGAGFYFQNARVGIGFEFGLTDSFYTFIPTSRFCERTPSRYYVSGSHSKTIYKKSVVINNYIRGNNNTIINEGIGRERVTQATKTPIRTVALRELPTTSSPVGRAERLEGNSLTVFRPNVSAQTSARPTTQRSIATVSQNPSTPSRSLRHVAKTETAPVTTSAQPSVATVAPIDPAPNVPAKTITSATRNSSPRQETISENSSQPVAIARPNSGSSELRSLPARSSTQERSSIERRVTNPTENMRVPQRTLPTSIAPISIQRETQIVRQPIARPEPAPSITLQQSQQTVREIRRPQSSENNSSSAQRSLRSIAPAPAPIASTPVQNFNSSPREVERPSRVERAERSVPQVSQPAVSAPAPSVRQSAPRQEAPASRERNERAVERSVRSERNRS